VITESAISEPTAAEPVARVVEPEEPPT
jgi:hypothetical protein